MKLAAFVIVLPVSLLALLQTGIRWRSHQRVGRSAPDITALAGTTVVKDQRVLVCFHNRQCHTCKAMTPVVRKLAQTRKQLYPADVADHPQLARGFGLLATPTVFVVDNGVITGVRLGAQTEQQLLRLL